MILTQEQTPIKVSGIGHATDTAAVRLAASAARPLALSFFRAVDLAAVLPAARLRAGDFFCAAVRAAVRDFGFCLAIDVLPFGVVGKR